MSTLGRQNVYKPARIDKDLILSNDHVHICICGASDSELPPILISIRNMDEQTYNCRLQNVGNFVKPY